MPSSKSRLLASVSGSNPRADSSVAVMDALEMTMALVWADHHASGVYHDLRLGALDRNRMTNSLVVDVDV